MNNEKKENTKYIWIDFMHICPNKKAMVAQVISVCNVCQEYKIFSDFNM